MTDHPADIVVAGLAGALLSGAPSTVHACAGGGDVLAGARAAGAMLLPHEGRGTRLLAAAVPVHLALSLGWSAVLARLLPRGAEVPAGIAAGLAIAALDLGVIAPRCFPAVRALPQPAQWADHAAFGAVVGAVLARRRRASLLEQDPGARRGLEPDATVARVPTIDGTDLDVFPLCLGGNVFGWTADERAVVRGARRLRRGRRQLHRHGRRLLAWAPGNVRRRVGDDHRPLDGRARQPRRDRHRDEGRQLAARRRPRAAQRSAAAADDSLRRLRHRPHRPLLRARRRPGRRRSRRRSALSTRSSATGKVRHIAASNYTARAAGRGAGGPRATGCRRYVALQPHYNLVERAEYEDGLRRRVRARGARLRAVLRAGEGLPHRQVPRPARVDSPRARRRRRVPRRARPRACWPRSTRSPPRTTRRSPRWRSRGSRRQPTVAAPIASARTPEQLAELLPMAALELGEDELRRLNAA